GWIEIYSHKRYFTVTGLSVPGTPIAINERQEALQALYRKVFAEQVQKTPRKKAKIAPPKQVAPSQPMPAWLQEAVIRATGAANGPKFIRLWSGDTSDYESPSEGDMALCCQLAYVLEGDYSRIEQAMSFSALGARDKWQREDYRTSTIEGAVKYVAH